MLSKLLHELNVDLKQKVTHYRKGYRSKKWNMDAKILNEC